MNKERFMKDFNGEKVFCLEYDKETLCDMVLELQERIDKAIEYIKENYDNATYTYSKDKDIYCKCFDDLLDILKGSDNNE